MRQLEALGGEQVTLDFAPFREAAALLYEGPWVAERYAAIEVEVWALPSAQVGGFLAGIPAPLGLGRVELEDGSVETGFICEGYAVAGARDITALGGWRAFVSSPGGTAG